MKDLSKRQKEIIDTSIMLISKGGIQELTIKKIADEIGISEPAIYRHFNCKVDILLSILSYFEDFTGKIADDILSEKFAGLLFIEKFFSKLMEEFIKNPALTRVIFSEEIFQNDRRLSAKVYEIMQNHKKRILGIIREGQNRGEIRKDLPGEHIVMIIMGSFRLLITGWRMSDFTFPLDEKGQELIVSINKLFRKG